MNVSGAFIKYGESYMGGWIYMAFKQMESAGTFLEQKGFRIEGNKSLETGDTVDLYAFRVGHSLWKFFPYEDHFFLYDFNDPGKNNAGNLKKIHESARVWVNARFSLPKWMRYKVPNIVTIAFSSHGFSEEMKSMVAIPAPYGVGGEKHSMILIDTVNKVMYSQGIQRTSARPGGVSVTLAPKEVDPGNRAYHLMNEFVNFVM
jgi:hypothetical protein